MNNIGFDDQKKKGHLTPLSILEIMLRDNNNMSIVETISLPTSKNAAQIMLNELDF